MPSQDVQVVYILGAAHSGSTILSAMLGLDDRIFAAGELGRLLSKQEGETRICACGDELWQCDFWGQVLPLWQAGRGDGALESYARQAERHRDLAAVPSLLLAQLKPSRALREAVQETGVLLRAVCTAAQRRVIVDSSKGAGRALLYSLVPGVDLRVVHLVRDGRGYLWSLHRRIVGSAEGALISRISLRVTADLALRWSLLNLACEFTLRTGGLKSIRLRYEDLMGDPPAAFEKLGEHIGMDLSEAGQRAASGEPLSFGHMPAGNPIRLRGETRLAIDEEWRRRLTPAAERTYWLLAGPVAERYGYPPS